MTNQRTRLLFSLPPLLLKQTPRFGNDIPLAIKASEPCIRWHSAVVAPARSDINPSPPESSPPDLSYLNPSPDDYSRFIFQDKCRSVVYAGSGGNGCVSFLREKFIEEGPANGGDGGSGGSVYIQAVEGITSLHKLARRGIIKAGRGKNGQGKSKGGRRGPDVLIQVPVGTVVREIDRYDPVAEEEEEIRREKQIRKEMESQAEKSENEADEAAETDETAETDEDEEFDMAPVHRDRWVLYPGSNTSDFLTMRFPSLPPRRQEMAALEPKAPIFLDLSHNMDKPMLLAAGAAGGLGNPHFSSREIHRPTFASKGHGGLRLELDFELKLLADVGLVGKPNAGKSTLLRSLTNSRTRIGEWEFTTLSPSIGTVVVDDHKGRPLFQSKGKTPRTNFTIADIPGLIQDAHLDRGLGLGFLRHIERARTLAFVIDLSAENPVEGLKVLWNELGQYQRLRDSELSSIDDDQGAWDPLSNGHALPELKDSNSNNLHSQPTSPEETKKSLPPLALPPAYTKPWFVVATKADMPETQSKFRELQEYLSCIEKGMVEHPGGFENGWKKSIRAVPVSAIRSEGVSRIPQTVMDFLDDE